MSLRSREFLTEKRDALLDFLHKDYKATESMFDVWEPLERKYLKEAHRSKNKAGRTGLSDNDVDDVYDELLKIGGSLKKIRTILTREMARRH